MSQYASRAVATGRGVCKHGQESICQFPTTLPHAEVPCRLGSIRLRAALARILCGPSDDLEFFAPESANVSELVLDAVKRQVVKREMTNNFPTKEPVASLKNYCSTDLFKHFALRLLMSTMYAQCADNATNKV